MNVATVKKVTAPPTLGSLEVLREDFERIAPTLKLRDAQRSVKALDALATEIFGDLCKAGHSITVAHQAAKETEAGKEIAWRKGVLEQRINELKGAPKKVKLTAQNVVREGLKLPADNENFAQALFVASREELAEAAAATTDDPVKLAMLNGQIDGIDSLYADDSEPVPEDEVAPVEVIVEAVAEVEPVPEPVAEVAAFEVDADEVVAAIVAAERITRGKKSIEILNGIHVAIPAAGSDAGLKLSASNLMDYFQTTISARVEKGDTACVIPGELFAALMRTLSGLVACRLVQPPLEVAPVLEISNNGNLYTITCWPEDDFPAMVPKLSDGEVWSIPAREFVDGLSDVAFATSADETKQVLTAVNWTAKTGKMEFAATDGHRLATSEKTWAGDREEVQANIPAGSIPFIKEIGGTEFLKVQITAGGNTIVFRNELGDFYATSLIEAQYPNYRQLKPNQFAITITIDKTRLTQAIQRSLICSGSNVVGLTVTGQTLTIAARSTAGCSQQDNITCEHNGLPPNKPFEIAFNGRYLMDAARSVIGGTVTLNINSATSPVVVQEDGFYYLLMPVQIRA